MFFFMFLMIIAARNWTSFSFSRRPTRAYGNPRNLCYRTPRLEDDVRPQLRERQKEIIQHCVNIAIQEKRALISAPTGYGKTAIFSSIITKIASASLEIPATETNNTTTSIKARKKGTKKNSKSQKTEDFSLFKAIVLSPTVELNSQNAKKFKFWNGGSLSAGIYGVGQHNLTANVIFATYQIFSREEHLRKFLNVSLLVIDEAHRAPTDSYQKVIKHLHNGNPELIILGLTATPSRADKKLMIKTFPSITSVVKVQEAIDEGVLVKPVFKTMVLKDDQADKRLKAKLYALEQDSMLNKKNRYAKLVDETATNDAVVTHWKEQAGDRQTVVFCCTIDHGRHVTEAFEAAGVKVGLVHSQMSQPEKVLEAYSQGRIQVIVNVFKLTEGWDDPPTSCVVLLRPSSYVNTWRQMIGRGLRASPQKNDCVVLDFGMSTLIHIHTPEVTGLDEEEEEFERRGRRGEEEERDYDEDFTQLRQVEAGEIEMKVVNTKRSVRPSRTTTTTAVGTDYLFKTIHSEHVMMSSPLKGDGHGDKWTPPVFKTRWSFPQCSDDKDDVINYYRSEEVGTIDGMMTIPSIAEHYVLQIYDVATSKGGLAILTQPYQCNIDWVTVCGGKDEMAVIACGDKHACWTAAQKWWGENWDHQYSQILVMDKPYSRPTEPQLNVLKQRNYHNIDHPLFTKYTASVLISLLVEKYKILDALDRNDAKAQGEITRRTPWRRKDLW